MGSVLVVRVGNITNTRKRRSRAKRGAKFPKDEQKKAQSGAKDGKKSGKTAFKIAQKRSKSHSKAKRARTKRSSRAQTERARGRPRPRACVRCYCVAPAPRGRRGITVARKKKCDPLKKKSGTVLACGKNLFDKVHYVKINQRKKNFSRGEKIFFLYKFSVDAKCVPFFLISLTSHNLKKNVA
jgi:hypothetical protein